MLNKDYLNFSHSNIHIIQYLQFRASDPLFALECRSFRVGCPTQGCRKHLESGEALKPLEFKHIVHIQFEETFQITTLCDLNH